MRSLFTLILLLVGVLPISGSHFRYAHFYYEKPDPNDPLTVDLTVITGWRAAAIDRAFIGWGDGTTTLINAFFSPSQGDWEEVGYFTDITGASYFIGKKTISHTYSSAGPFNVGFSSCCRIGGMLNGGSYRVFATVDLSPAVDNASPRIAIPPVVQMIYQRDNTIDLAPFITDLDGDNFTCAENFVGGGTSKPSSAAGFSISSDCKLSWDLTSRSFSQLLAVPMQIISSSGSSMPVDFIIESVPPPGPTCPPQGSVNFVVSAGSTASVNFTVDRALNPLPTVGGVVTNVLGKGTLSTLAAGADTLPEVWKFEYTVPIDATPGTIEQTTVSWTIQGATCFQTVSVTVDPDGDGDGIFDNIDNANSGSNSICPDPVGFNPDQLDTDDDGVGDVCDECPTDENDSCDTNGFASVYMTSENGGTLSSPDGKVTVTIPPGVINPPGSTITIAKTDDALASGFAVVTNLGNANGVVAYDLIPSQNFNSPGVQVTLRWDDVDSDGRVDSTGGRESNIRVVKDGIVITDKCSNEADCNQISEEFTFTTLSWSNFALVEAFQPEAPVITDVPLGSTDISDSVTITLSFTDINDDDNHVATFDWGDGSTPTNGTVDETANTATGTYTYPSPGVYEVTVSVTNPDASPALPVESTFQYVVIYDPLGGFVTGGGWFNSPQGASVAFPTATGKANFGFVSKYNQGATAPVGQSQFSFKAGDLNFHSDEYDWLVVAGHKAIYKGVGTINNNGNFGFLISCVDGDEQGNGNFPDKFRIKIWDKDDGDAVVYDNEMGADENAESSTVIGGGNIKIHP